MFAVQYANNELDKGTPPLDVLIALSDRLGHGPSRAKMILDVYCWQIRHRFPEKIKLPTDFIPRERTKAEERAAPPMLRPSAPFKNRPRRARRRGPARTHHVNDHAAQTT